MRSYRETGAWQTSGRIRWAPSFTEGEASAVKAWAKDQNMPVTTAIAILTLRGMGLERAEKVRADGLPPQQAAVFDLVTKGRTPEEIAVALGIRLNHARVVIANLRKSGALPVVRQREAFTQADIDHMLAIMRGGTIEARLVAMKMGRKYSGAVYRMMRLHGAHLMPDKREYKRRDSDIPRPPEPNARQPWKPGDPKPDFLKRGAA